MPEEIVDIINENNEVIGQEPRSKAHSEGLLHRAVHVILYNSDGEVCLQKRSASKRVCPLKWDFSSSEHLQSGESYEDAGKRGLKEEVGAHVETVETLIEPHKQHGIYGEVIENEINKTLRAVYDGDLIIDKEELDDARFFRVDEINNMIKNDTSQFTPWFLEEWETINKSL